MIKTGFILFLCFAIKAQCLQSVSDDELLELIREKEKLIVLFTKDNCKLCDEYEKHVDSLQEDFQKHLNAPSVIAINSHLARLYNPAKEPALVFFRHGVPLLYSGDSDENDMFSLFEKNQSPVVKELTDKTFEHMTQAATGATTGDWFVMFGGASCVECQRLHAVWEGAGAALRGRVNVARLDADVSGAGADTARRFRVTRLPAFLFFRLGKVYRYNLPKTDVKSFVSFAQDWYKNAKGETVPLLSSPFDEAVEWCVAAVKVVIAHAVDILARHPWLWQTAVAGFGLVAITALIALLKAATSKPHKQTKKEKKLK